MLQHLYVQGPLTGQVFSFQATADGSDYVSPVRSRILTTLQVSIVISAYGSRSICDCELCHPLRTVNRGPVCDPTFLTMTWFFLRFLMLCRPEVSLHCSSGMQRLASCG